MTNDELRWHTPPVLKGQIVVVAYALTERGVIRRTMDRSVGTVTYCLADWDDFDADDTEPWNEPPSIPAECWEAIGIEVKNEENMSASK